MMGVEEANVGGTVQQLRTETSIKSRWLGQVETSEPDSRHRDTASTRSIGRVRPDYDLGSIHVPGTQ